MSFFQQNNTYNLNEVKNLIHSNIPTSSKHFFNLDTSTFGNTSSTDGEHPFLILKKNGLLIDNKIEDRMQCVRYMLTIPYKDCIPHTLEVVKSIQNTTHFNIYKRFHFWSTQDISFKLHDEIIHEMHPYFFTNGLQQHYPLDLMLSSATYILSKYGREHSIRQDALDFIVDCANDKNSTYRQQYDAAEVLIKAGEADEVKFGRQIHKYLNTISSDIEKINKENKCIKKIRFLATQYPILSLSYLNEIVSIFKYKCKCITIINDDNNNIFTSIFDNFTSNSTFTFENFTFTILFYFVYQFIQHLKCEQKIKEFTLFLINTDTNTIENYSSFVISLFNTICKDCIEVDKNLRISLYQELKDTIFNRYNIILHSLPSEQKEAVIQSIQSKDDKMDVEQFLDYYSIEDDIFKKYKHECTKEQYTEYYNKIIIEYCN
jgi:hypothetical protein